MGEPILELKGVWRTFPSGEGMTAVLRDVDLTIREGDMVAIVGASGSGKSTLMNILGCLDQPSAGTYRVRGRDVAALDGDERAALRRETFGFIFQRYHLLGEMTALGNVEAPAVYAGVPPAARRARATALLARLGLEGRLDYRPGQLSGGQQQRVSIARALMNGGDVVLADEPTGALDSRSGEEVLRILEELNAEGRTVVIVTHDMAVARRARRIVELSDGVIVSDRLTEARPATARREEAGAEMRRGGPATLDGFREILRMAVMSMRAHRLRTFLTMLGIVIGIAAVVNVVALGSGAQQRVLADIAGLGTNTLEIFPGRDMGDVRSGRIRTLVAADAAALAAQPYAAAVTPVVQRSATLRFGSAAATATVVGAGEGFFDARGMSLASGRLFDRGEVDARAQVAVIDTRARDKVFGEGSDPIGEVLMVGRVPVRVIGVANPRQGFGANESLNLYMPYTTAQTRLVGSTTLRSIVLRVSDAAEVAGAEAAATELLAERHGAQDFFIINTDEIRRTITSTTRTMTLLVGAIAVISLVVGGIGVMNIMLVSVSERVGEIGVRMAVGARRSDILRQFLAEAVLVCALGGLLGVAAALGIGMGIAALGSGFSLVYSPASIGLAVASSMLIGVVFGYLPARRAAGLNPVAALSPG